MEPFLTDCHLTVCFCGRMGGKVRRALDRLRILTSPPSARFLTPITLWSTSRRLCFYQIQSMNSPSRSRLLSKPEQLRHRRPSLRWSHEGIRRLSLSLYHRLCQCFAQPVCQSRRLRKSALSLHPRVDFWRHRRRILCTHGSRLAVRLFLQMRSRKIPFVSSSFPTCYKRM